MNENTQELFDNFTAVIRDLTEVAGHIAQIEDDKAEAASLKHHERMDGTDPHSPFPWFGAAVKAPSAVPERGGADY